jgi:hypothetical protein
MKKYLVAGGAVLVMVLPWIFQKAVLFICDHIL